MSSHHDCSLPPLSKGARRAAVFCLGGIKRVPKIQTTRSRVKSSHSHFELLQKYDKSRDSLSNSGSRTPINSTRLSNLFWTANHHFWKHWLLPGDSASWWLDITDSSKIRSRSTSSWMLESSSCWGALRGCDWCICWYTMRKTMKNSADEMMQDRTIIPVVPKSKALIPLMLLENNCRKSKNPKRPFPSPKLHLVGLTKRCVHGVLERSLGQFGGLPLSDFNPKALMLNAEYCFKIHCCLRFWEAFGNFEWPSMSLLTPKPDTLQQLPNPVLAEFHLQFQQSHRLADHGCLIPCLPMVDADKLLGMRKSEFDIGSLSTLFIAEKEKGSLAL